MMLLKICKSKNLNLIQCQNLMKYRIIRKKKYNKRFKKLNKKYRLINE